MKQRINAFEQGQGALKAMLGLSVYLAKSTLEKHLLQLIEYRVSQINGCAYCLDMHSKDLRHGGETERRIYMIAAWRETSLYSQRERAALLWAESVTLLDEGHVPDDVYDEVRKEFSEAELIDLTLAVATINSWNRINIALRTEAGGYKPGQWSAAAN